MKYLKLTVLCLVTYLSGVALFYLTGHQIIRWFFPEISVWWVFLETVVVSVAVNVIATLSFKRGYDLDQNHMTYAEKLFCEVITEEAKLKISFWGFDNDWVVAYELLFMASFGVYLLFELLLRVIFLFFIFLVKGILKYW